MSVTTHATIEECLMAMEEESQNDIVIGEADDKELTVFAVQEDMTASSNADKYNLSMGNDMDVTLSLCDWLADSATALHITNQRNWLGEYVTTPNLTVAGVGNATTAVKGKGIIILTTECEGHRHNLRLDNVLYIPTNKNNLLSLG